jgi:uncharacterized membrane protein YheB (UPF0754 family)
VTTGRPRLHRRPRRRRGSRTQIAQSVASELVTPSEGMSRATSKTQKKKILLHQRELYSIFQHTCSLQKFSSVETFNF